MLVEVVEIVGFAIVARLAGFSFSRLRRRVGLIGDRRADNARRTWRSTNEWEPEREWRAAGEACKIQSIDW